MAQQERPNLFMFPPMWEDLTSNGRMLPHSLEIIHEFLDQIHAPEEHFDSNGEWESSYRILVALRGRYGRSWNAGALKMSRCPSAPGLTEMQIAQSLTTQRHSTTNNTNVRLKCAADQLATPREWEVRSVQLGVDLKPVDYTRISLSGAAEGSTVRLKQSGRKTKLGKRFTSNWSLFDAVQRLPFGGEPVTFDLLEDLEKPKRGHRLYYSGSTKVGLGGKPTRLHSFAHLGEGILPYTYWLDDRHRLLMAVGGLVTFLFDPAASLVEEKQ